MSESKEHKEIKQIIANCFHNLGYRTEMEHTIGKTRYDVVFWNKENKKRFIEIFLYPVRLDWMKPNIVCKKCGYSWNTSSQKVYVSCPDCLTKVNVEENKLK